MIYDDRIHKIKMVAGYRHPMHRRIDIFIRGYGFKDGIFDLANIEWKEVEPSAVPEESITIDLDTAQELINSLWECGLRPAQGQGSAGQLETMKAHLEDMRNIAFKFLKIEGK